MEINKIKQYSEPTLEVQGLKVEEGYAISVGVGIEPVGDLEELN